MCYLIFQKCKKLLLLSEFKKKNAHSGIFCAINVQKMHIKCNGIEEAGICELF